MGLLSVVGDNFTSFDGELPFKFVGFIGEFFCPIQFLSRESTGYQGD